MTIVVFPSNKVVHANDIQKKKSNKKENAILFSNAKGLGWIWPNYVYNLKE